MRRSPIKPGTGFKRPELPKQHTIHQPIKAGVFASASGMAEPVPKKQRDTGTASQEQAHKYAVASLGCAVCWRLYGPHDPVPVELHHLRADGWGKGGYKTLIPLCYEHHRGNTGVHGLGTKGFAKHYGFDQQELLEWSLALTSKTA